MREMVENIRSLFTKDTSSEGESAKLLIVLRILHVSMGVYSLINTVYCLCTGYCEAALCFAGLLAIFGILLFISFRVNTVALVISTCTVALAAIISGFIILGPGVSGHDFFIVVVVMVYFSGYGHYKSKGVFTFVVFIVYFLFQSVLNNTVGYIPLSVRDQMFIRLMNILTSFWCVALVCYVYSKDSQHLEGKLIEYNKILRQQASTDTLTGLSNRRSANEYIEKLVRRNDEKGFCVCMCDIDFFKKVNDSYGHDIGDKVLAGVAQTLVENVTEECLVARWG